MMNRLSRLPRPKVTVLNIFEYFTHERKLPSLDIRIRIRSGFIKHIFGGFFLSSNETMFHGRKAANANRNCVARKFSPFLVWE